jgi:ferredoxin
MKIHLIYFSPTGTTKTIVNNIAKGIGGDVFRYDVTTDSEGAELNLEGGIAVFGVPVYAGRVPVIFAERIKKVKSEGIPAVVVGVYGNREYEDALVELRDIVSDAGFRVIGGGAFIGEHSYSTDEKPIAKSRPDSTDCLKAEKLGKSIRKKLENGDLSTPEIEGNVPYKERMGIKGATPLTKDKLCISCGVCVKSCPTDVITLSPKAVSNHENCIMCCACVKKCPLNARYVDHPGVLERVELLFKNCSARKEPVVFL